MAKSESAVAVLEFNTPKNSNVRFAPLQRSIRGVFDLNRVAEPNAGQLRSRWPEPVPGQRLQYDFATGEGFVLEPLHEERFAAIRERIEGMGLTLAKERESFHMDAATFHYWIAGLVQSGDAKLLQGTLPASVDGTPRTRFHSTAAIEPLDKLTAAIERQSELQVQLIEAITRLAGK